MNGLIDISPELSYFLLLFGLFVVPKILQRWRIPSAIASFALGVVAGPLLGFFEHDSTINLLSTLGIVSLFLFAGIEVEIDQLRQETRMIGEHLIVRLAALVGVGFIVAIALGLDGRAAALISLAILTPSTGFILDSLPSLGLKPETTFWVRSIAIATELLALAAMFVTLQSASVLGFATSSATLIGMILILPLAFRAFARLILPYAPKTEFAFLLMISVVCALVTKKLGVYYLVGAFVVGMVAQRFRAQLPAMASERMLDAISAFASIFVPFYFFHAGLLLQRNDFSVEALVFGGALLILGVPFRLALVSIHRKLRLGESLIESMRIGIPMLPTLVFTLIIAQILRENFDTPSYIFGGLVIYAIVTTVIPSFVYRTPPPEFETPEVPHLHRT